MIRFLSFFSALILLMSQAIAQNGRFDVRLKLQKADCIQQKLQVNVEIKAHDAKSTFLMGDANFRFAYTTQMLKNPSISKQFNFSSIGEHATLNYNPLSLNGSVERDDQGLVSLNIIYNGSEQNATQVGATWMPIATIQFDMVNVLEKLSTAIQWHDNETFPITGLNEVILKKTATSFDYDSQAAKPGGVFESLTINSFADICSGTLATANGELMIPEGFSPNGDGSNDAFEIRNLGNLKADLTVFDRNGSVVYQDSDYQNDWTGRSSKGDLPAGTYFYSVRLSDGRTFTHSLTISR